MCKVTEFATDAAGAKLLAGVMKRALDEAMPNMTAQETAIVQRLFDAGGVEKRCCGKCKKVGNIL